MICENIKKIKNCIPNDISIVAVSKTKPKELILEAYKGGHKVFGENKVQELIEKEQELPKDISWHFIGHLQRNKVKFIAPFIDLIHGVDSFKLLKEINKQAKKHSRIIPCLLQFHIAKENTKFGFSQQETDNIINSDEFNELQNIKICGVMGMASNTNDEDVVANEFANLKLIFTKLQSNDKTSSDFKIISMGMSNDYNIAIKQGSNMIRVGSIIFGKR